MYHLAHKSVGFRFSSDLPLLTLKGTGLQYVDSTSYCWDNHIRQDEHCLIQFCLDGEGALIVGDHHYVIHPGDAFLIDIPSKSRYYLPEHSSCWEFVFFEFSKECLPLLRKIYSQAGPVVSVGLDTPLAAQMLALYEKALTNSIHTIFENSNLAYGLWMELIACALAESDGEHSPVEDAKRYIDQNYSWANLNLDSIADHVGLSKYYLCKEFQRRFGTSPGRYLREVRMAKACRLLMTNTNYTMEEIAHLVGYSNNNYFGKVFRAEKGMPPHQYQKQCTRYDFVRAVYETTSQ